MIAAVLLAIAAPAPFPCGAATRPGVAELGEDGVWRGRAVELCRAMAARIGGPGAPIAFHSYDAAPRLRAAAEDRIAFVSAAELAAAPGLRAGPAVAIQRQVLAVEAASPVKEPRELAGELICFIIATRAEDALDAWAAGPGAPVERLAFQEPAEMRDALDVGRCAAEAVDAAEVEQGDGARALDAPLFAEPIFAATPAAAGDAWARAVAALVAARAADIGGEHGRAP